MKLFPASLEDGQRTSSNGLPTPTVWKMVSAPTPTRLIITFDASLTTAMAHECAELRLAPQCQLAQCTTAVVRLRQATCHQVTSSEPLSGVQLRSRAFGSMDAVPAQLAGKARSPLVTAVAIAHSGSVPSASTGRSAHRTQTPTAKSVRMRLKTLQARTRRLATTMIASLSAQGKSKSSKMRQGQGFATPLSLLVGVHVCCYWSWDACLLAG